MGSLSSTDFRYQDPRKLTWVRGTFHRGGRGVGRLLMCISLAIYMADIAIGAQRSQPDVGQTIAKVVDEFFAMQPGYEKGDLIRRSQVEQVIAKVVSKGVKIS